MPFGEFERRLSEVRQLCSSAATADGAPAAPLVVVCRRGNDSQVIASPSWSVRSFLFTPRLVTSLHLLHYKPFKAFDPS